jgi:FeS assembly SUF system protein
MTNGEQTQEQEPVLSLEEQVVDVLRTINDPEIPVNIYDLGLVYSIDTTAENVTIQMTLVCHGCPVAGALPREVKSKVMEIPGVKSAKVELVWDPPWRREMISDAGKLQLGML